MQNPTDGSGATSLPPFKDALMDYVVKVLEKEQPTVAQLQAAVQLAGILAPYILSLSETGCATENKQPSKAGKGKENTAAPTGLQAASGMFSYDMALNQAVNDWIKYKSEKKQGYKPKGLQSLLTQIQNNVDTYGNAAVIHAINESMASNYQGIVWDKAKAAAGNKAVVNKSNQFFELAKELEQEEGGIYDG